MVYRNEQTALHLEHRTLRAENARLRAEVDGGDLEAASNVVVELNFYGKIEGEALAKADGEGWSVAFGDRRRQA